MYLLSKRGSRNCDEIEGNIYIYPHVDNLCELSNYIPVKAARPVPSMNVAQTFN